MDPITFLVDRQGVPAVVHGPGTPAAYRPDLSANYYPGDDAPPGGTALKGLWKKPDVVDGGAKGSLVVSSRDYAPGAQPAVARVTVDGKDYAVTDVKARFWFGWQNGTEFVLVAA